MRYGSNNQRLLAGVVLLALPGMTPALGAQPQHAAPPPSPHAVSVVVKTIGEEVLAGQVQTLSMVDGLEIVVEGVLRTVPTQELVRVTTSEVPSSRGARESVLTLADGGTLIGRLVDGGEDSVVLETRDLGKVEVGIEAIATWLTPNAYLEGYRKTVAWLAEGGGGAGDAAQDQVLLTNGDVVDGFVSTIGAEGIRFESAMGETLLPHRVVVAARFGGGVADRVITPHVIVSLRSSGRLAMSLLEWRGAKLRARLNFGPSVQIEAQRVVALDFLGGLWEWLPSRPPISFEHTPMLGLDWNLAVDRNVLGGSITVAHETYEHGIGVHGRTRITYDLQGRYRELVTQFGMDDHSGPFANIDVQILVDSQRRFAQVGVRRGTLFGPVRVDVSRANRIELVTDFGENGDIQDRFNWVETALIR